MVACFIGHRTITVTDELSERIRATVLDLVDNQGVNTFLFGSRSQFDELCLKIVTEIIKTTSSAGRLLMQPCCIFRAKPKGLDEDPPAALVFTPPLKWLTSCVILPALP